MRSKRITREDIRLADKVVILHETAMQSWTKDAVTFGCIAGLAWFNHTYLGGSWVLNAFAVIAFGVFGVQKVHGFSMTVEELRDTLSTRSVAESADALTRQNIKE